MFSGVGPQQTVLAVDLSTERRWLRWGPAVAGRFGVASLLVFGPANGHHVLGALSLYATRPYAFDEETMAAGSVFASHAAMAVSGALARDRLHRAIGSRTAIGQARGMLMDRHQLTAEQPLDVLRHVSQDRHIKPRQAAEQLTRPPAAGLTTGADHGPGR